MQLFPLLIIFWVIAAIAGSGKNKKQQRRQPPRRVQFPAEARPARMPAKPKPAAQPMFTSQPAEGDCDHEEHYSSALQPAAPTVSAAPAQQPYTGSIEMAELTEGVDPCHDGMEPLQVYDEEADVSEGQSFLNFNPNAMVNAIVMNEILKRPGA